MEKTLIFYKSSNSKNQNKTTNSRAYRTALDDAHDATTDQPRMPVCAHTDKVQELGWYPRKK